MKVEILDSSVFHSLDPEKVTLYLKGQNWRLFDTVGKDEDIAVWDMKSKSEVFRVRVPLNQSFVDFDESLGLVVKTIASASGRSQLEVLDDLETIAEGDVIRLSTHDPRRPTSTTIPLLTGVDLFERARKLASAAALAAESRKPVFSTFRSKTVLHYLESVRLGQTEMGSYRIKLISPLPTQNRLFDDEGRVPFSRVAVNTLLEGLDALSSISKKVIKKGYHFEEFDEAVSSGVSANLCEALISSSKQRKAEAPIEVDVTWSEVMSLPKSSIASIVFNPSQLAFVEMAAKDFRERNEVPQSLEGYVVALSRESVGSQREPPRITVATAIENKPRRVHIAVHVPFEYDMALQAHRNNLPVRVFGTLKQVGRFLWLEGARHFEIPEEYSSDLDNSIESGDLGDDPIRVLNN